MLTLPEKPYHIIENYIDLEYCNFMKEYFEKNAQEDPREFYGNFGLGGYDDFFVEEANPKKYDPKMKLREMIHFGHKFFKDNYPIFGEFKLNRSHVNYMYTNAQLDGHKDDRNWDEPIEDLPSKTHVMGLFLNDDYEGGELFFEDYQVSLKPKPGTLVFFPGYYTRHAVNKVTSGTRINILTHYFDIIDQDKFSKTTPYMMQ